MKFKNRNEVCWQLYTYLYFKTRTHTNENPVLLPCWVAANLFFLGKRKQFYGMTQWSLMKHGKTPVKVTGFCFKLCGTKGLVFVVGKNLCSSQYIQCSLSPLQEQRFPRAAGKAMGAMMRTTRHHSYKKGQHILILCHTYSYLGLVAAEGDPLGSLLQQLPCMTRFCAPSFARLT